MALSGRINGSVTLNSAYFSYYILWSATQDIVNNTSTVTVSTYWSTNSLGMTFDTVGSRNMSITIDGTEYTTSKVVDCNPWPSDGIYLIQTESKTVTHDADGTKSITISARSNGHASSYGPSDSVNSSGDCTASATITLNAIDRTAPTVSISLANRTADSLSISCTASAQCDRWYYKLGSAEWASFSQVDGTAVTLSLTGLSPSTTYAVQVRARKTNNHVVGYSGTSNFTTIGAATINSAAEIYADASTVIVSVNAEVYNASYTYSLAIKRNSTTILTLTFPAQAVGTRTLSATLTSTQRTNLLSGMSDVASFSATYELTSVNSGSTIGTSSTTAMIRTSASTSAPGVPDFTYKDNRAATVTLTGDNQKLIQGQSSLQLNSLSSSAHNGASIANYTIVVGGVTVTSANGGTVNVGAVSQSGTLTCQVTATDTRGYTATKSINITCYAYDPPMMTSGVAVRDDIDNEYIGFTLAGSYSVVGSNTVTAKYKYKKTAAQSYSADTNLTLTASSGSWSFTNAHVTDFDADDSYDVIITISDALNSEEYAFVVPPYSPLIAYRLNGIGINKVPSAGLAVDINGDVAVGGTLLTDPNEAGKVLSLDATGKFVWINPQSAGGISSITYNSSTGMLSITYG